MQGMNSMRSSPSSSSSDYPPQYAPPSSPQGGFGGGFPTGFSNGPPPPGFGPQSGHASSGVGGHYPQAPPPQPVQVQMQMQAPVPVDPLLAIPPEPQALVVDDSIVLIRNPREFHRKKNLFTASGPAGLQVFSDFERVLTGCRSSVDGSRLVGTAELLEMSPALMPAASQALRQVAIDFDAVDMDDAGFEEYTRRCQQAIAQLAGLHLAAVPPVTRDFISSGKLSLREGAAGALASLSRTGVPTFVFSSGYGDIVTQCLVQAGCVDPSQPLATPQNVRVIR